MLFDNNDEQELEKRGLTSAKLVDTIYRFTEQTLPIQLERPCTAGDGVFILNASDAAFYQQRFDEKSSDFSMMKFVPASGAASRMFKHIFNYSSFKNDELTEEFILNFDLLPFYSTLEKALREKGESLSEKIENNEWEQIFHAILHSDLHYAIFPKGLIPFHKYSDGNIRTAFEEHMHEAVDYGREKDGTCRIHFTLAPHQVDLVMQFLKEKTSHFPYENFILTHSLQDSSTDTPALDKQNNPVRDENGKILFRPAGHGALIHNLQKIEEDIIFIKNIDNVTTSEQKVDSIFYKKVLAGMLIELKNEINQILHQLDTASETELQNHLNFVKQWFVSEIPYFPNSSETKNFIKNQLDRPLRICGMVKNEGEPGGGPFWIKSSDGHISKQIVEKSQVDHHDVRQMKILSSSTHFNPVDIVCSIKNAEGKNYNLQNYIDHSSGFVSEKFLDGKIIKALELPGLWNGSMALWNTVFVEVPNTTFNPVKTVNDLLRTGHQSVCD